MALSGRPSPANVIPRGARVVDHVALAVGTSMGLFIVSDSHADGPFFPGSSVASFMAEGDRYTIGVVDPDKGPGVRISTDGGQSWVDPADSGRPISFPAVAGESVAEIWDLHRDSSDGQRIWAGAEPAALFVSEDDGASFELVRSLWDHPHRPSWEPGCRGLVLHSVVTRAECPGRILLAASTGGVYRSDDGAATWQARNKGIAADFLADPDPEFGHCIHKLAVDAVDPDLLWAQNHGGLYRSTDAGDSWTEVGRTGQAGGLPSDFGYTVVAHPAWSGTANVVPLASSDYRCTPGGRCRVYRTQDAGETWEPLAAGLPQTGAHMTVLRDALTAGPVEPYPLAFGTRSGEVYVSVDGGEGWRLAARHLPAVLTVRVLS